MGQTDAKHLDITMTNKAVQELIEVPRHRYLLQAYDRHRNLEHAGRFEEIFAAEMTVEHPVYRFNMIGRPPMKLAGRERVAMVWPYDERCRLIGENVWEYDDTEHDLIELDPNEVLTTQPAAELLEPQIKPLPPFDDSLLPRTKP